VQYPRCGAVDLQRDVVLPSPPENRHVTIIKPPKGWIALDLREFWEYRDMLWYLTTRDVKSRYRQMALGSLWIILRPIFSMLIFSIIFGEIAKMPSDNLPYPIFSYSGLLPWGYFSGAALASSNSLRSYMNVISKVYFPRLIVPIAMTLSGLLDLAISFIVLVVMMFFYGYAPTGWIVLLPLYVVLAAAMALAIGLWTAAVVVRYRDLGFVITYFLQFGLYFTPVAYASSAIPERWQTVYQLNPMFWVVEGFRWTLLDRGHSPEPLMAVSVVLVLLLLASGMFVFRRTELTVVDLL
jgi:lipopolysaccharide transport system permease protein